ncbi:MAG TPA: hypothetical protein VEC99_18035 [Clostridia bacterium]|nr:hypothetical protein [Clostridia bacterium]
MNKLKIVAISLVWSCVMASFNMGGAGFSVEVGDILCANYGGNSVLKIQPQTGAQEVLGTFTRPTDLVLTESGDLYVSELGGTISRLTLSNGVITVINPNTTLTVARGLALGPSGDLFVTGSGDRVLKINPVTGQETLVAEGDSLTSPIGIDFVDTNTLAVASMLNSPVVLVNLSDMSQTVAPGAEGIDYPWGIAVREGDIYFTRTDQKALQKLSDGTLSLVKVTQGFPYGIAIEPDGNLLVASHTPDIIERISPQGTLLRMYSGGTIGHITGIEVSRIRVGAEPAQVSLQSCETVNGHYQDDPEAFDDPEAHAITVAQPSGTRFYRLRASQPLQILKIRRAKTLLVLEYEFR